MAEGAARGLRAPARTAASAQGGHAHPDGGRRGVFVVGLRTDWGYEQTNVDFYQVVRVVSAKSVELRKIAKETTEDGFMCGNTIALKDQFLDCAPVVRRAEGERVLSIDRCRRSASKWDGKPQRCSWYA
jgi:hypothetical protein